MDIGIFSRTFQGGLEEVFSKIRSYGLRHTHLNLLSAGMETMPERIDMDKTASVRLFAKEYGIILDGLSGTFNMIAPDQKEREDGIVRFQTLCCIAQLLDVPMISLCTGSRNPKSKWMWDERNLLPDAWDDLKRTTERILAFAQEYDIILGVETEASNIINTPRRAREYLDTFKTHRLKIIMDGANLFLPSQVHLMRGVLEEAFALLGHDIVQAHAKDLTVEGDLEFVAAGEGVLDFPYYVSLLRRYGYEGTLMLHGLSEAQVQGSVGFLKGVIAGA